MSTFPDQNASKKTKSYVEYGLDVANSIYSEAISTTYGFFSRRAQIKDNQLWAEGGQSIEIFKDELDTGGDVSWLNLNFDTPSPLPKLANLFVGTSTNRAFSIQCEALDNQSKSEKDEEYNRRMVQMALAPLKEKMANLGIDFDMTKMAESEGEIEDDMELNYKVPVEEAIELCTRDVFKASGEEEIQRKVSFDIFENNAGCTKIFFENGQRKFRHVKLENLVTSYVTYDDYRDMYYIGEVYQMGVSEAMQKFPNVDMSKEDWARAAANFSGKFGNDPFEITDYYNGTVTWDAIRSYKIQIMDFEYKVNNTYKWKDKRTRKGTKIIEKVTEDYDASGKHNTKVETRELADIYEGMWIIHTEHMLRWKLKSNMTRKVTDGEISGNTDFSYTIYKANMRDMVNKSLCELIKPHAKQIIIYNLKIMQMVMKARPAGAAIDITALGSVAMGLGDPTLTTSDPLEIYAGFDQTGLFVYSSVREDGTQITNNAPIQPLDGGISNGIQNLLLLRNAEMQEIYNISGFNPAVDGSQANKDASLGIEEMRANSFNITMKPYLDSITKIIRDTASKIAEMEKDRIVADKSYAKKIAAKIGNDKVTAIDLIGKATLSELSIYMEYAPEGEDKMKFEKYLQLSIERDQITAPDAMDVEEVAKTSIKGAIIRLKKAIKRKERAESEAAAQREQSNASVQIQSAQAAEQAKQATLTLEYDLKMRNLNQEYLLKANLEGEKGVQDRITAVVKGDVDIELIEATQGDDEYTPEEGKVSSKVRKRQASSFGGSTKGAPKPSGTPRVGIKPEDNAQNRVG